MASVTIEQIMHMAEQLSPSDQLVLVEELQARLGYHPERSRLLAEFARRKATGAFDNLESLYGKFADPQIEVSEEELTATIREAAEQWKEDLDGLVADLN